MNAPVVLPSAQGTEGVAGLCPFVTFLSTDQAPGWVLRAPSPRLFRLVRETDVQSATAMVMCGTRIYTESCPEHFPDTVPFTSVLTTILQGRHSCFHFAGRMEAACPKSHDQACLLTLAPSLMSPGQVTKPRYSHGHTCRMGITQWLVLSELPTESLVLGTWETLNNNNGVNLLLLS